PVGLLLARAVIVDEQDEVRALADDAAHVRRGPTGDQTGDPAPQPWFGDIAVTERLEAVADAGVGRVAEAGFPGGIDVEPRVMDDPSVSRPELDRRDGRVAIEGEGEDERAIDVAIAG